jgi:hypothetical protein
VTSPAAYAARGDLYPAPVDHDETERRDSDHNEVESTKNMPSVLRSLAGYDLQSGSLEDVARMISKISVETRPDGSPN